MTTHLRPHTASNSPVRPVSSYSMSSTIRRVTPSPDSLSEALSRGYATHSTPRHPAHTQSLNGRRRTSVEEKALASGEKQPEHDTQGHTSRPRSVKSPGVRPHRTRRVTPSRIPIPAAGRSKAGDLRRRKAGRISPSKLGAPRQHRTLLSSSPTTPSAQVVAAAGGSLAASAALAMPASPTRAPPPVPRDERARLREFTLFSTEDPFAPLSQSRSRTHSPISQHAVAIDPTRPAARRESDPSQYGTAFYEHEADATGALATSKRGETPSPCKKESQRIGPDAPSPSRSMTSPVKQQQPRHGSAKSVASTFSTPGRDEMERKRGITDEGPFANVMGVQALAEQRRIVSEGKSGGQRQESEPKGNHQERGGMCRCVVM